MPFSGRQPSHLSNQNVCGTTLRPDITARVGNHVFILDVTCPFEGKDSAFSDAYSSKTTKYESLIPLYQAQGLSATIVPFIVGALGSLVSLERQVSDATLLSFSQLIHL
ncbi:hypothetical protein CEXT_352251 [Caerostris extrusa]|uniref:Uncharacterized protein n=1 Tax=Caerostris extrusa TaxID=172846 RepID=A0AAV4WI52_CAEEX|nr:hypothetical protein CEXT_352251 [Caerostris extrusa]